MVNHYGKLLISINQDVIHLIIYQFMTDQGMNNYVLNKCTIETKFKRVIYKMNLADRVKTLTPSSTLAISAKAKELKKQGHDVIGLGVGEPDFNTPEYIIKAAEQAMHNGKIGRASCRESVKM